MRIARSVLLAASAAALLSQPLAARRKDPPVAAAGPVAGLAPFIDTMVRNQIATQDVAGAVVVIVYRGKVVLTRGYGYADIERRRAVDPDRTVFRPGSVSKMIVWTALMQQVEAGKIDLDSDVNRYLDFRIPDRDGGPIRVRDLMSHTLGMSDLAFTSAGRMTGSEDFRSFVKTNVPARVAPAGREVAYSNYGAALAGYIVERVSGERFEDYVARRIFKPLGMKATEFHDPLPARLARDMAVGYGGTGGRLHAKPYERFSFIQPAVGAATTAPDMARFMIAMLGDGAIGKARILKPASVALLECNSVRNAPDLPGMAHGWLVVREGGPRLLGHGGNTIDFHSQMTIAPDSGFGMFVSMTGGRGSYGARTQLSDAIIGRVFPQSPAPRWTGATASVSEGRYASNRRDYGGGSSTTGDVSVRSKGPRMLTTMQDGLSADWVQIGPKLYERADAPPGGPYDQLEFYTADGVQHLSFASMPHEAFQLMKR